jgi:beta-glucosidase
MSGQRVLPYKDASLPVKDRVEDLVARMTLDEKIGQMMNSAPAIPRLGVPEYDWWSEGLHGIARSGYATMFPQAIGMAATWDQPLVGQIGTSVSIEARAKYNQAIREDNHARYFGLTIWSPNINIFRDPRWGRGQETYGEDPYLTSRLGVAFVDGLQGTDPKYYRVVATPKHFAVHSGPEASRHRFDVEPSPMDLGDTYLPAFRATVTEGHAESVMCAYNAVDGVPACANTMLLDDTLRKAWGFKGYITSDCGAVDDFFQATAHHTSPDAAHASATAVLAGTDTNCGDTYKALGQAVADKLLPETALDTALRRLFTARFELGMFDPPARVPYAQIPFSEVDSPAHRALALRTAHESMVLLKNDGLLPLNDKPRTIAVVGPNAAALSALEGNYNAVASHPVLPVDGLIAGLKNATILYAQGSAYVDGAPVPAPRTLFHPAMMSGTTPAANGLTGEYFANSEFTGKPVLTRVDSQIDFDWNAATPVRGLPAKDFGVRWKGTITAPAGGDYTFSITLAHCYPCSDRERFSVYMDDKLIATNATSEAGSSRGNLTPEFQLHFADTAPHEFRLEYSHHARVFGAGLTLNWIPPAEALRSEAVAAAQKADLVVAFVGLSPELEGEEMPLHIEGFAGGDRTDIKLPGAQEQLLEALAATGKPLVVVLMNGSALAVNWAQEHANAVLESWYPGEAGGEAIADTLAGRNNPAGRLPITFYSGLDQLPDFTDYSMKNRTYRYFHGKPLYGFGYGLSYTHFAYSHLHLSTARLTAGGTLMVDADVRNAGKTAGDEVAQLYLIPPQTDTSAIQELSGFQRVHLAPGETRRLHFALDPRQLSQVDAAGIRSVTAGKYEVSVGGGQPSEAGHVSTGLTIEGGHPLPR